MATPAFYYLSTGQFGQAILWVLNDYIGYGIVWAIIGIMIMGTVWNKSKSYALTGFFFAMFLSLINVFIVAKEVQLSFLLIVGVLLFIVVYKVVR